MNIFQRINEVRKVVKYIQKDRQVQTYKAVSYDMVIAVLRDELIKNGIMIYPEQVKGLMNPKGVKASKDGNHTVPDTMQLYEGGYIVHFVNIDQPEDRISVPIEAHANDNGDKAPGKAYTYAQKAAILKIFSLETGENEESRVPTADVDDEIAAIEGCETIEALQKIFAAAWVTNQSKAARDELTRAKDAAKARLIKAVGGNE